MADAFMAKMQRLFEAGQHAKILEAWSAETSNSDAFKRKAFGDYKPEKQDVIVATYPKSGTTWAMQIAYQIGFHGAGEFEHMDRVVPWPDKLIPMENPEVGDMSVVNASPTGLHVIKSHLESDHVPYSAAAKYLSIIRDPKDMLVSIIHFENGFNKILFDDIVPVDAWVEAFQTDRFIYQPWPMFVDSWWKLRGRDNVLVLTYEEMKADSAGVIQRTADFLGVSLTPEQFAEVARKSSFGYMKANDHKFAQPAWDQGHVPLIRSGKTGSAKELLSLEHQARIDAFCQRELERLGSDFPYREKFGQAARS